MLKSLKVFKVRSAVFLAFLTASLLPLLMACDYDDHDDFDHDPPAGQGALYIVNRTSNDSDVFIDGERVSGVDGDDDEWFDLAPGAHRVVVTQDHTDRVFRDDVDVLDGQRTILELSVDPTDLDEFDVFISFD